MAEFAVTFLLAEIEAFAVSFLRQETESLLRRELGLNKKIKNEIDILKRELQTMNAFLKDADAKGEHDHQVNNWILQVQDLAFDTEHVLELFAYSIAQKQAHWYSNQLLAYHSIDDHINGIKSKLQLIGETKQRYHNIISTQATSSSTSDTNLHPRIAPLFMEDADTVGIEGTNDMLTSWALTGEETYKVMFVVGMGGSGKTTLVKKTFEGVKEHFDCYAWITASKFNEKGDLLLSMFNQFSNPMAEQTPQRSRSSSANEDDLIKKLRYYLQGKSYVVVLDDLWLKNVWESLSCELRSKYNRGRVIITTRRGDIAYAYSCRDNSTDIHNIRPLPLEHARELFYNTAFSRTGSCPQRLERWAQNILQICEGLPLGIIEIGQYLSTKEESESQWKFLHDSLESELTSNGYISNTMKVLFLSYSDLPYHLKYCFLYLSIFPEGSPVKRRRLIRLWIAEGFVREKTGKQLEDVGEEYLKELVERSLIHVSEVDFDGRPSSCRVHNLMHKIILSKSQEVNFSTVCKESSKHVDEKTRRISIQKCSGFNMEQRHNTCARTLFMFDPRHSRPNVNFSSLNLLKVLHLEGAAFDTVPDEIVELLLLRYLCLSNTRISSIPKSLGKLQHLETLDLKQTLVTKLPKKVTKLAKLRHLLICYYNIGSSVSFDCVKGFEISDDVGNLTTLQKLSFLKLKRHKSRETILALGNLSQLRKLGIIDLRREDGPNLCFAIQKMRNLQSLNVTSTHKEEFLDLHEISDPPLLHRLYLKGRLEKLPPWISRLHDLIRIRLKWSKLSGDNNPILILQDLPNLLELQLLDAYTGEQLEFFAGKFQKLRILEFEQMEHLRMVIMDGRALPSLQKIIIRRCSRLVQVPVGIDDLTHLKELILCDMPRDFVNQLKEGGALRHLVHHIQSIYTYYAHSNGQMESEKLS